MTSHLSTYGAAPTQEIFLDKMGGQSASILSRSDGGMQAPRGSCFTASQVCDVVCHACADVHSGRLWSQRYVGADAAACTHKLDNQRPAMIIHLFWAARKQSCSVLWVRCW